MNTNSLRLLILISALAMVGCAVTKSAPKSNPNDDLILLANYKQWTLVNPEPQLMEPATALDCALIPGRDKNSPHLNKYISVFVNPVGKDAMMTKMRPVFPVGSMIIKEKLSSPTSKTPELLTAMIKRKTGYNPESGDWEYLVLNGTASEILERGKLTSCAGCHSSYKFSDFVTRTYLPASVRREMFKSGQ